MLDLCRMCLLCDPICPVEVIGLAVAAPAAGAAGWSVWARTAIGDRTIAVPGRWRQTSSALCILPSEFLDFHR